MAAGAGIAEHGGRRDAVTLDLGPERLEQLAASLRAAASLTWRSANEDLAHFAHAQILCREQEKSRRLAATASLGAAGYRVGTRHPLIQLY